MDFKDFSNWYYLNEKILPDIPKSAGVYVVRSNKGSVPRLFKEDPLRILHIENANNLHKRIQRFFKNCMDVNKKGCRASSRYRRFGIIERYPFEDLSICWKTSGDKNRAKVDVSDVLREYIKEFGELPPLDYELSKIDLTL